MVEALTRIHSRVCPGVESCNFFPKILSYYKELGQISHSEGGADYRVNLLLGTFNETIHKISFDFVHHFV